MTTGSEQPTAIPTQPVPSRGTVVGHPPAEPPSRTLVDLLERAADRFGDRPAVSMRTDDGELIRWSYRELDRRSRLAAWRLRARGLEPGDRLLTWSPSAPELVATYFGAMRAGIILVPLDLRMAPDAARRIADRCGARQLMPQRPPRPIEFRHRCGNGSSSECCNRERSPGVSRPQSVALSRFGSAARRSDIRRLRFHRLSPKRALAVLASTFPRSIERCARLSGYRDPQCH